MGHFRFFLVESRSGGFESLLFRVRGVQVLSLLDFFAALLHLFLVREFPQLVVERHRLAPVGRGALRVPRPEFRKGLLGFLILEGMKQRYSLFDKALCLGGAAIWKVHFAEMFLGRFETCWGKSKKCRSE